MPLSEIYIKLVTGFPNDPKVRALARLGAPDAGLARDLYVQMCLYCKDNLTDGLVPEDQIGILVYPLSPEHGNQLAKQLALVGLIEEVGPHDNQVGNQVGKQNSGVAYQVLAYVRRNGTREDVERLSEIRAEAGRAGGRKSRKRPAQRGTQANSKQVANQVAKQNSSKPVSDSVSVKNTETESEIQAPTVPAAELTLTQRSKRITDAYAEAQPMCRWPAINGVVMHALKSGKYADDEIREALLRMAKSGQTVTVESLRVELEGLAPRGGPSRKAEAEALRARIARENPS